MDITKVRIGMRNCTKVGATIILGHTLLAVAPAVMSGGQASAQGEPAEPILLAIVQVESFDDPEVGARVIRDAQQVVDGIIEITPQARVGDVTAAMVSLMTSHARFGSEPPAPYMAAELPRADGRPPYINPDRRSEVMEALELVQRGQTVTLEGYGTVPGTLYNTSVKSWVGGVPDDPKSW